MNYQKMKDLIKKYCKQEIDFEEIEFVDFKVMDILGCWKHLTIPFKRLTPKVFEHGIGFDGSSYGYLKVIKSDMIFKPDIKTPFIDPFSTSTLSFLTDIYQITDDGDIRYKLDPRFILQNAIKYMKETGIADEFIIGPEYEFNVFTEVDFCNNPLDTRVFIASDEVYCENSGSENLGYFNKKQKGYHSSPPFEKLFEYRNSLVREIEEFGIDIKYHHHEVGSTGQVEIEPELGEALKMADATLMIKYLIHNYSYEQGLSATFMPKPIHGEAGNGMHIHMLLKKDGKSICYDENGFGKLSENALHFIAGILKHGKSLCALTNPSTNSYKRLIPGFEAPVGIVFDKQNRNAAIRIPGYIREPEKVRFEFRPSDAMANPYLAIAGLLLAGIQGIKEKIPYDQFLPCEQNKLNFLPGSLNEALIEFEKDNEFLIENNIFPKEFIQHWINLKRQDIINIQHRPHPYEFDLYYSL